MTLTDFPADYLVPETPSGDSLVLWPPDIRDRTADIPASPEVRDETAKRAIRRMRQMNDATRDRVVALRLVMARLEGMTFRDAASLLGVKEQRLAAWLRETESIPKTKERRIRAVHAILRSVGQLVPPEATGRWFALPIPVLGDRTPFEVIATGRVEPVIRLAQSYTDPSFG